MIIEALAGGTMGASAAAYAGRSGGTLAQEAYAKRLRRCRCPGSGNCGGSGGITDWRT